MAAAPKPKKGALDSVKAAASTLLARVPFLPRRQPDSPEPFSAIEDETPLGDLLSSANAAPGMAAKAPERAKLDLRAIAAAAVKNPSILAAIIIVLVFILALAITAIIVSAPPKAITAQAALSEKGEALVRTWLSPPGDPLEPRMAMTREGSPAYTAADAARIGLNPSPATMANLRDKNDEAIADLLGTVP
jgi:hypothetical protein